MRIHPQSGYDQPNSLQGLILWIDASEPGTLSRSGADVVRIYDKAPGGYMLNVQQEKHKPKILQSRFHGKTVIRFEKSPQFMVGESIKNITDVFVVGVINQELHVNFVHSISFGDDMVSIPSIDYDSTFELAEMVVYDCEKLDLDEIEWVIKYLCNKWNVKPSRG